MPLVSTMILASLRLIGEKARTDTTLTTEEQAQCPAEMNMMVDSWSVQKSLMLSVFSTSFPLTASTGTYTIGTGATFNMTRPIRIVDPCFVRDSGGFDSPVEIIDEQAYGEIPLKGSGFTYPDYLFYDGAYSQTSSATIRIYPLPQASLTLFLNTWQPLESISSVSQNLILPPGYHKAIVYNYAIDAAGGFTKVSDEVAKGARDSLAAIKSNNLKTPISRLDYGALLGQGGRSNILTGP